MKRPHVLLLASTVFLLQCVHSPSENNREPSSVNRSPNSERNVFEQCSNGAKLYLETGLMSVPSEYLQLQNQPNRIPVRCVQFAQRNFSGGYAVCADEESRPVISSVRPCMTEAYVMLAYNSFHDVMDCFNLDPRDFFLQIMIESGFHVNAINRTGFDAGISQFTANGIKRVSANNLIERTRRVLLESSRPSCQRISSIVGTFNSDAFTVQKRCAVIALPRNPYRAMLFNYLHTMLDQMSLEDKLSGLPEIQSVLTPKLKRQLTYLAYNRGLEGTKRLLQGYVQNRQAMGHVISAEDLDLNQNLARAKKTMKLEPEKRERLKQARIRHLSFAEYAVIHGASYLSDMVDAGDYVQRHLGDSCGGF